MSKIKSTRVSDGVYEATIDGVVVRVTRGKCGTHPRYGTFSHQPNWTARAGRIVLSDGNGTLSGALEGAARSIEARGMGGSR